MDQTTAEIESLYVALSGRVQQIVRGGIQAPEPVIEDACQFAWTRFVLLSDRVCHEAALPWLVKTAIHEAFKLIRRERRELSLDAVLELAPDISPGPAAPAPDELLDWWQRLEQLGALPERQRRLLWMRGLGLSYTEMARSTGCTTRTVERQLLRAGRRLQATAQA